MPISCTEFHASPIRASPSAPSLSNFTAAALVLLQQEGKLKTGVPIGSITRTRPTHGAASRFGTCLPRPPESRISTLLAFIAIHRIDPGSYCRTSCRNRSPFHPARNSTTVTLSACTRRGVSLNRIPGGKNRGLPPPIPPKPRVGNSRGMTYPSYAGNRSSRSYIRGCGPCPCGASCSRRFPARSATTRSFSRVGAVRSRSCSASCECSSNPATVDFNSVSIAAAAA